MCIVEGCTVKAKYNIIGGKKEYCGAHKTAEMVAIGVKRCSKEGCNAINPVFDIEGGKGKFCSSHKLDNMINVKGKRCSSKGCTLIPGFGIIDAKERFCKQHKTSEMTNLKDKRCKKEGCDKVNPTFGHKGRKGQFCLEHKEDSMINVKSKRCNFQGCDKVNPTYDVKDGTGKFCKAHKSDNMINVKSKRCEKEGCTSINPVFDKIGGKGRFCSYHKSDGMIDVKNARCVYEKCMIISPEFDHKGGKGRFCITHKTDDMINVREKLCQTKDCPNIVTYGKPGTQKSKCFAHREKGMIKNPNSRCKIKQCIELAMWGTNWIPSRCNAHKIDGDQNLVEQPCSSCNLMYILDKDNKCENCNPASWAKACLAKQNALMDYLDVNDLKGTTTDKIVNNGICGKERPDRMYDFGDKIIILECDENQHKSRNCVCEQTRMVNLGQSFGGIPVYFIRWNPDMYEPGNDALSPEGIGKRYKLCRDLIMDIKLNKIKLPEAFVSAIYLYFDGWTCLNSSNWITVAEWDK